MNIILWIVFGLIVGVVASFLSPNFKGGIISAIILGIIGAVVGGFLGQTFFGVGVSGFNLPSFVVAVIGALIVIFLARLVSKN